MKLKSSMQIKSDKRIKDNQSSDIFNIIEGKKSIVKRVRFKGNKNISGKQLRGVIFTREDWIFGFMDKSGAYSTERLEADKRIIEQYYQSNGYLAAKVTDAQVEVNPKTQFITVTFYVQEGDLYTVNEVKAPGNDLLKEEFLLQRLPMKAGQLYSRENIVDSIKLLELIWGEFGYINASIEPSVVPDETNKTVNVTFYSELGTKVFLNRINIIGNKKTRDKVIRRKIGFEEGNLLTTQHMEDAKNRIEALGYFDPKEGVNWKVRRLSEGLADLDLFVKEEKTGHAHLKFGFGGTADLSSPATGLSVGGEIVDTNLFGKGMSVNLNASISKEERNVFFNITEPWLFDRPITAALDLYHRRPSYDDLKNTNPVNEVLTGGSLSSGFFSPWVYDSQILLRLGFDSIRYEQRAQATVANNQQAALIEYQKILDQQFISGEYPWFGTFIGQDRRNHPIHTFNGYRWGLSSRFGFPTFDSDIGFYKIDLDMNWYTPLIGDNDLVLKLHGFFGIASAFGNHRIPYRDLFHIGGPASIRGFLFGQAGPKWQASPNSGKDSIGGRKALFLNAELIFPIKSDMTMKGVFFYDGGTGWDNPLACQIAPSRLVDNTFTYRHSVGVGIRMLQPAPIKIDWGFKLDPRKRLNETASEIHFSMTYDW
jgi:outer membrane protein insertion porin family